MIKAILYKLSVTKKELLFWHCDYCLLVANEVFETLPMTCTTRDGLGMISSDATALQRHRSEVYQL